jgi:hypothetical protein
MLLNSPEYLAAQQQAIQQQQQLDAYYSGAGYLPGQNVGTSVWQPHYDPNSLTTRINPELANSGSWELPNGFRLQYAKNPVEEGWYTDSSGNQVWGVNPETKSQYQYTLFDPAEKEGFWSGTLRGFMPIAAVLAPAVGGALLGGASAVGAGTGEALGSGLTYSGATGAGMAAEGALGSGITGSLAGAGSGLSSAGLGTGITAVGGGIVPSLSGLSGAMLSGTDYSGMFNSGLGTGNTGLDQAISSGVNMDGFYTDPWAAGPSYTPGTAGTGSLDLGYDLGGSSLSGTFAGGGGATDVGGLGSGYSGMSLSDFTNAGGMVDSSGFAWDKLGNLLGPANQILQGVIGAKSGMQQANLIKEYQGMLHDLITNPNSFAASPAAQAQLKIGSENLARQEAAKGYLGSGNILAELQAYGQDVASKDYYKQMEMLAGLGGYHAYNTAMGQVGAGVAQASNAGDNSGLKEIGQLVGIAGGLASLFSDRRLKKNIKQIGVHKTGIPVYEYDYLWGEHAVGVMADDVEKVMPEAVTTRAGYKTVNYQMLEGA